MKYLIVFDDYSGGAGNIAQLLAIKLAEKEHVDLLLLNKNFEPRYYLNDNIKEHVMPYKEKYISSATRVFDIVRRTRNLINQINPDVIISFINNNNTMVSFANILKHKPLIVSERSNPVAIYPNGAWKFLRRIAYRHVDVISVLFDEFKTFDNNRFYSKCIVTPNIVLKPEVKKETWKSDDMFRFVSLGRYCNVKRFPLMIEMFEKASNRLNNIELHLYGWGDLEHDLYERTKTSPFANRIVIHKKCEDVFKTLIQYDCYLMTSEQEGFPNSLCEAMSVGLPTISLECHSGIKELCNNGKMGICIDNNDETSFVNAMIKVASDEEYRSKLGGNAQKLAEKYNERMFMESWLECINKAMKKKRPM